MENKFLRDQNQVDWMPFLSSLHGVFGKPYMGGSMCLPARQKENFSKTNKKFQFYQNQNLSWLLEANWKGQKHIYSLLNCLILLKYPLKLF